MLYTKKKIIFIFISFIFFWSKLLQRVPSLDKGRRKWDGCGVLDVLAKRYHAQNRYPHEFLYTWWETINRKSAQSYDVSHHDHPLLYHTLYRVDRARCRWIKSSNVLNIWKHLGARVYPSKIMQHHRQVDSCDMKVLNCLDGTYCHSEYDEYD